MKISKDYSVETPYFTHILTETMKTFSFYSDSVETANEKIKLMADKYGPLDMVQTIDATT